MESWRRVWRNGIVPLVSIPELEALRDALQSDDPRLIQGATTVPPPLYSVQDWPCEAACAISIMGTGVLGNLYDKRKSFTEMACVTVGTLEEYFAKMCFEIDSLIGEPAGCRWFLNWYDETPREEMIRELLPEVILAISTKSDIPIYVS